MKLYRLQLTPQTNVRTTQGDSVFFRIPENCPYTLKEGNTVTVTGSRGKPDFKAVVVLIGDVKTKVSVKGKAYSVANKRIQACDGIDCKHKLSEAGRRRLKRIIRYNDYKEALKSEAHRVGMILPDHGAGVMFFLPMPIRWNKTKRAEHHMNWHKRKPDLDNMLKAFMDGLMAQDQGIAHFSELGKKWVDSENGWIEVRIPDDTDAVEDPWRAKQFGDTITQFGIETMGPPMIANIKNQWGITTVGIEVHDAKKPRRNEIHFP